MKHKILHLQKFSPARVRVNSLVILLTLIAILTGLFLSGISDTSALVANTSIPDNGTTDTAAKTNNFDSSAGAIITITMTTARMPDE